jgi:ribosomal protein S18 acetylase RimI-like enzyme
MSTVLTFSRIEPEGQRLLLTEIRKILREVGSHNVEIYNDRYWDWQYKDLPTGISFVYAAWDGDKIIGYFHVPVYQAFINGQIQLIGNVQDVAVISDFRGMGVFRSLAEFANQDLDAAELDFLYTFPNKSSIRTFRSYNNFSPICTLPSYFRPIDTGRMLQEKSGLLGLARILGPVVDFLLNVFSKSISLDSISLDDVSVRHFTEIDESVESVFREYGRSFSNHIIRDAAWLDWRYLRSVRGRHQILGLIESGQVTAAVVLKEETIMNASACVVMDFAFTNGKEKSLLYLIQNILRNSKHTEWDSSLMYISGSSPFLASLKRLGFIQVPEFVNPRVLNLLGRSANQFSEESFIQKDNWLVTLGDWDVF